MPVALVYDHMLLLLAVILLVREAKDTGFLPWERLALAGIYILVLLTWLLGTVWHLPLGPVAPSVLLLLCVRRVWRAPAVTPPRSA